MEKRGITIIESLLLGVAAVLALGVMWYLLGSFDGVFNANDNDSKTGSLSVGRNSLVKNTVNANPEEQKEEEQDIFENETETEANKTIIIPELTGDECNNGIDDDNDGLIDFIDDPECESFTDLSEGGPSLNRELYSTKDVFVTVCLTGCSYKTIQEAVNKIPIFVLHQYKVEIKSGDYNEDVRVPMFFAGVINNGEDKVRAPVQIHGTWGQWDSVKVNSFIVGSVQGYIPLQIAHLTIKDETPYGQAKAGIEIYNSEEVTIDFVKFSKNVANGVLCSRSRCYVDIVMAESGNNIQNMFLAEEGAYLSSFYDYNDQIQTSKIPGYLFNVKNSYVNYDPEIPTGDKKYPVSASSGIYQNSGGVFVKSQTLKNPEVYGVSSASELKSFIENKIVSSTPKESLFPDIDSYLVGKSNSIGNGRKLYSTTKKTISVCSSGCDYTKIQDSMNEVPLILKHDLIIKISDGFYDEDVVTPLFIAEGSKLTIIGNSEKPENVIIGSMLVDTARGKNPILLEGFKTIRTIPYDDESRSLSIFGNEKAYLKNLVITNPTGAIAGDNSNLAGIIGNGFLCYSSVCYLDNINFGINEIGEAMRVKHGGIIIEETPSSGTIKGQIYSGAHGFILAKSDSSNFGNYTFPTIATVNQGIVINILNNIGYNLEFK